MLNAILNCFKIPELRQRIIFTLALLVIVRIGAAIPVPGVNPIVLDAYFNDVLHKSDEGSVIALFNLFSGGALQNCAIFALTIMPYISASIVMQLATGVIPSLGKMAREEGGRQKITQYTRLGTLLICVIQGFFLAQGFQHPEKLNLLPGIETTIAQYGPLVAEANQGWFFIFTTVVTLTAGTMLLMWLGEQITDKGIGNGVSLIISVGIVAQLPAGLAAAWRAFMPKDDTVSISPFLLVLLIGFLLAVIAATIMITQAMRKVTVQYAKQVKGNKVYGGQTSFLPMKVNYSGVMPIIFANAILLFPATFIGFLFPQGAWGAETMNRFAQMLNSGWLHYTLYAIMIFFFSYFWVAVMFNPVQIADDMKKHGGFIPGIRPGEPTAHFLNYAMTRLTFAGAIFLVLLAILPMIVQTTVGVPSIAAQFFGGTGLLIIVGVMLDTMKQAETHLIQRNYEGFLKKGKLKSTGRKSIGTQTTALPEQKIFWLLFVIGVITLAGIVISIVQEVKLK